MLQVPKPLQATLFDDVGQLGLIGFLAYVDVSHILISSDLQYHSLTPHVKCIKPILSLSFKVQHSAPYKRVDMTHAL